MVAALLHQDPETRAPLTVWYLDGHGAAEGTFLIDDPVVRELGLERVEEGFAFWLTQYDGQPEEIWLEFTEYVGNASWVSVAWWDRADLGGPAEPWLRSLGEAWMRFRFGDGTSALLNHPLRIARYRFAATRAHHLAAAALPEAARSSIEPVLPLPGRRISTRVVPFVAADDDVLIVVVGSQEPPNDVALALPYALELLGDRELRLVVPAGSEWPILARLPWLHVPARVRRDRTRPAREALHAAGSVRRRRVGVLAVAEP